MWIQVLFVIVYTHFSTAEAIWSKFYFLSDPLYIFFMLSTISWLVYFDKLTFMDIHFLIISILFNLLRSICYYSNDFFNIFKNTYTFEIIGLGIIIATFYIITSGIRHGLFNDYDE